MGKRSPGFEKNDRNFYPTPPEGMAPLLPHLVRGLSFVEPCAGAGAMVDYFESAGHPCVFACDIHPLRADITKLPATALGWIRADLFITNPPWDWDMVEPIIQHLSAAKPTWLLLSADFMHNLQAQDVMDRCSKVVPIGRLKWIPGTKHGGVDNVAWYLFQPGHKGGPRIARRLPR